MWYFTRNYEKHQIIFSFFLNYLLTFRNNGLFFRYMKTKIKNKQIFNNDFLEIQCQECETMKKSLLFIIPLIFLVGCCENNRKTGNGDSIEYKYLSMSETLITLKHGGHEYIRLNRDNTSIHSESCPCKNNKEK